MAKFLLTFVKVKEEHFVVPPKTVVIVVLSELDVLCTSLYLILVRGNIRPCSSKHAHQMLKHKGISEVSRRGPGDPSGLQNLPLKGIQVQAMDIVCEIFLVPASEQKEEVFVANHGRAFAVVRDIICGLVSVPGVVLDVILVKDTVISVWEGVVFRIGCLLASCQVQGLGEASPQVDLV